MNNWTVGEGLAPPEKTKTLIKKREHQGAPLPKRRATSNSASHRDSHAQVLTVGEGLAPPEKTKTLIKKRGVEAPPPTERLNSGVGRDSEDAATLGIIHFSLQKPSPVGEGGLR